MRIRDFLTLVTRPERVNYFVVCPDNLGLGIFLGSALAKVANAEDIRFLEASTITKKTSRELERETRMAPRGSSKFTHYFLYRLQNLPKESVGPLLKAVEEAKFSRFIFQAQTIPRKLHTLMSRSSLVKLPFLSKAVVLANMKAMAHDARLADQLGFWDGTLMGTITALQMKDVKVALLRELRRGSRGFSTLATQDTFASAAFDSTVQEFLNLAESRFLERDSSDIRKRLVLFSAMERVDG